MQHYRQNVVMVSTHATWHTGGSTLMPFADCLQPQAEGSDRLGSRSAYIWSVHRHTSTGTFNTLFKTAFTASTSPSEAAASSGWACSWTARIMMRVITSQWKA
jgi:hypothetical protein